jgi:hypothetical protein
LTAEFCYDPSGYNNGKNEFIAAIDKKAAKWARKNISGESGQRQ